VVREMMLGRRSKLASYLVVWGLVGVVLLAVPTLISPIAQKDLTSTPIPETNTRAAGTNTTTSHPYALTSSNKTIGIYLPGNYSFSIQSSSPTNITIVTTTGSVHVLTITSEAPANVTVTTKSQIASSATAAPISSNIPDFALRLSLVLMPAVVLSSLGLVRVRSRFRRELEQGS